MPTKPCDKKCSSFLHFGETQIIERHGLRHLQALELQGRLHPIRFLCQPNPAISKVQASCTSPQHLQIMERLGCLRAGVWEARVEAYPWVPGFGNKILSAQRTSVGIMFLRLPRSSTTSARLGARKRSSKPRLHLQRFGGPWHEVHQYSTHQPTHPASQSTSPASPAKHSAIKPAQRSQPAQPMRPVQPSPCSQLTTSNKANAGRRKLLVVTKASSSSYGPSGG